VGVAREDDRRCARRRDARRVPRIREEREVAWSRLLERAHGADLDRAVAAQLAREPLGERRELHRCPARMLDALREPRNTRNPVRICWPAEGMLRPRMSDVIDFAKGDGLVPVIVQDDATGDVLMLAYMNRAAFERTVASGYATYWSRSRNEFWVKGETSGHL